MYQAKLREDGKYENRSLGAILKDGFTEVVPQSDGSDKLLDGTVVEYYVAPQPKTYNAKRFLASCMTDESMVTVLDKLDAKQESRLMACLQNANFEMLEVIVGQLLAGGVINNDDVTYFKNKLKTEEGIDLDNL